MSVAVLAGGEVFAADVSDAAFEAAKAAGVKDTFLSAEEFADLDLDVIIDFAGVDTTKTAIEMVKHGGRVVQVGLGKPEITFPTTSLVFREVHLVGSLAGSTADTAALYEFMADGSFSIDVEPITFDEINDGLLRMRRGELRGRRLVADYSLG
ncbi:zinc-binding dehydrogenase [Arthrobacter hankyongi]|uniref:zinc-binding dehydrogenase n=1 Tax=Arthrobacter hankyongi TaxID=2904801 RepID=UPI003556B99A